MSYTHITFLEDCIRSNFIDDELEVFANELQTFYELEGWNVKFLDEANTVLESIYFPSFLKAEFSVKAEKAISSFYEKLSVHSDRQALVSQVRSEIEQVETAINKLTIAYQVDSTGTDHILAWQPYYKIVSSDISFDSIGAYDSTMTLVFEIGNIHHNRRIMHISNPEWSTYFGDAGDEETMAVASDDDKNTYHVGYTSSLNFPVLGGSFDISLGGVDGFVSKFGNAGEPWANNGPIPDGDKLLWSTYYGGTGDDKALSVMASGNGTNGQLFVTGETSSNDFKTTTTGGNYKQLNSGGGKDAFLLRLDTYSGGNNVSSRWSTYFGGSGDEVGNKIIKGNSGNIFLVGTTSSDSYSSDHCIVPTDDHFPYCSSGTGIFDNNGYYGGGSSDGFIAKFNNSGTLTWSTFIGGSNADEINSAAFLPNGSLVVGGSSYSSDYPAQSQTGAYNQGYSSGRDGVVSLFIDEQLNWSSYFGGGNEDVILDVESNSSSDIFIAGWTQTDLDACSTCRCTVPGTYEFPLCKPSGSPYFQDKFGGGSEDGFFARFNNSSKALTWSTYFGGDDLDEIKALKYAPNGNLYFAGRSASSAGFPTFSSGVSHDWNNVTLYGPQDPIVGSFNSSLVQMWTAFYGNGNSNDWSNDIEVAYFNTAVFYIYLVGTTYSNDLNTQAFTGWAYPHAYVDNSVNGGEDGFMARFSSMGMWMSIEDKKEVKNFELLVYPNPSSNIIYYQLDGVDDKKAIINLFDVTGRLLIVKEDTITDNKLSGLLDLTWLPKGIYLLKVNTSKTSFTKKVVLE